MISALKVKEVFYKEILPALDYCNYGITDERTLIEIKNLSKMIHSSPKASSPRIASTSPDSAFHSYRTRSKGRSFGKPVEKSPQQSSFKVPASTLITPEHRLRSSDHSCDTLHEKSLHCLVEFMKVENETDDDNKADLNDLFDPLQPSQGWENFNDDYGGGVLFTSSQIEPSTETNFIPMPQLPANTSDVKEVEGDSISAKMDLIFADSEDSDSLFDVDIKEAEKEVVVEADSTSPSSKPKTQNIELTSIQNEPFKKKNISPISPPSVKTPKKAKLGSDVTENRCFAGTGIVFVSSDESDGEAEEVQEKTKTSKKTEADPSTKTPEQNITSIDEWLRRVESRKLWQNS